MTQEISFTRSDVVWLLRCVGQALSEIEAGVADGLIDERVLEDLQGCSDILEESLR